MVKHTEVKPAMLSIAIIMLFAVVGSALLYISHATTPALSLEAENGSLTGCVSAVTDSGASGGRAVTFGGCRRGSTAVGASLPITYDLASLSGTVRYVAMNGNDSSGNGTAAAPYATLARAVAVATSGDSIVVRGGVYRQGDISVPANKTLKIIAYPGETPIFDGAFALSDAWTTEGNLKYHTYTPMPVTDGSGISFTSGQNLAGDGIGKYPDQAWVGNTELRQVSTKSAVTNSTFYVDRASNRLYVTAASADSRLIESSWKNVFITVSSPGTSLIGFKITRFSNTASDYGVVKFQATADQSLMENDEVSDTAFIAVSYGGGSDLNTDSTMRHVTLTASNWMGVSATYTDYLTLDGVNITKMNQFDEFTYSPQSGALKTSRTRYTKVINSNISDNHSQGLWFDQSNYQVDVANNTILDNLGSGVFYEISDDLLLVNNYIRATGGARAVKLSGSSGLKLVNNTIIGGADPVGVYTDNRSSPDCADPARALCVGSYSSDRDTVRPYLGSIDWIPRIDMMLDNIIAYPTAVGYCGVSATLCITTHNGSANINTSTIIHKANSLRSQTVMAGNVYANSSGKVVVLGSSSYTSAATFGSAMRGLVGIDGLEAGSLTGNEYVANDGSPTTALSALYKQAPAVPTDTRINQYVAAGNRHYGVLSR